MLLLAPGLGFPIGGHSLIEPFGYSIPVVCGPYTEKTRDVARSLLERRALIQVQDATQLAQQISRLAANPNERLRLGATGRTYLNDSQGAVNRTLLLLNSLLETPAQEVEEARPKQLLHGERA